MTKEVQKWADAAMFTSAPLDARTGPQVHVLSMNPDPLGSIAAATLMYRGIVVRDLAEVTDEQRREAFAQIQQTKLKAPFEFVKAHLLLEGVTRSFTHQLVRQRTAVYAQESLRFAVVEDGFTERVALPPSLAGVSRAGFEEAEREYLRQRVIAQEANNYVLYEANEESFEEAIDRLPERERQLWHWEQGLRHAEGAYASLVNSGIPAEDARGLLPHNITTRVHYSTDLRALQDHAGNRLCTQAQFEWRAVWVRIVQAIREYGRTQEYRTHEASRQVVATWDAQRGAWGRVEHRTRPSAWQFDLIANLFRPVCYLTGKCEFAAQDLDRKCSIRSRVDMFQKEGVPSSEWGLHTGHYENDTARHPGTGIPSIDPAEWLTNPEAAR